VTLGERPEEVLQGTPHPSEPSGADDLGTARGILAGLAYSTISSTLRSFRVALPARRAAPDRRRRANKAEPSLPLELDGGGPLVLRTTARTGAILALTRDRVDTAGPEGPGALTR
jgi:hypothetical protein